MENALNFYDSPQSNVRLAKARLVLGLFSRDMVEDIILLVQNRGNGTVADVFNGPASAYDTPRPLGVLSREYVADEDVPALLLSFSTLLLSYIRKPRLSNDNYQQILQDAFGLPSQVAEALAKNIETYDPVSSMKTENGEEGIDWEFLGNRIANGVRQFLNWIPKVLQLNWEIDQNQDYDKDFLYEMVKFGEVIAQLNRRARLMTSQVMINQATGLFALGSGDPANALIGDSDENGDNEAEAALGAQFRPLTLRALPTNIAGPFAPVIAASDEANMKALAKSVQSAGYDITKNGLVDNGRRPAHPGLRKAWDSFLAMNPGKIGALSFAAGALPGLIKLLKGDPTDLYGDIRDEYGDAIADKWRSGDIDGLVGDAIAEAGDDVTTGDPDLDKQIGDAALELYGDTDGDPEIGGMLTRWRVNRAKRRFKRSHRRTVRRANRRADRAEARMFDKSRDQLRTSTYAQPKIAARKRAFQEEMRSYMPEEEIINEEPINVDDDGGLDFENFENYTEQ